MNALRAVVFFAGTIITSFAAFAQDAALLPEAQKAFDRGIGAVQQQQWGQAVRHFTDAHKIGGNDPRILLNLGLAQARLGNELHAIGWLNAAAAAAPDSPNAKAIPQETQRLKELVVAKIDRLLGLGIAAAEKMPEKETVRLPGFAQNSVVDNYAREAAFAAAAAVYAKAGNDERALALYQRGNRRTSQDDIRGQRARALAEADDFDRALSIAEGISEGFQRNSALAGIVEYLLSDRYYTGKVAAEDIAQAQRFLQPLADPDHRKQAEARLTRLGLRHRFDDELDKGRLDASLLDQLLAASEASSRPWLLQRVAHFQTDKADFSGARRTIERMGSGNPVVVADALTAMALMQLKAGRRTDAAETARRLAGLVQAHQKGNDAYSIQPLEGVVKAVLGDFNGALQIAARYGVPPNQIYTGIPEYIGFYDPGFTAFNQRQSLVGAIVFCAAMTGRMDDAMRIARQEKTVSGLQNYAHTNIAYAHLLQGSLPKAIEAIRTIPVRNEFASDNARAQILGLILVEHVKRGDLKAAELTVRQMTGFAGAWKHGARYRVEGFIRVARAYHGKAQASEVMRLLAEAKRVVRDGVADPAVQREGLGDVDELRERIAFAQVEFGDSAGAAATRAEKTRFASEAVKAWVAFVTGDKMSQSWVLEPEKHTLEEVSKPAKGYPSYTGPVEMVAAQLRRIVALERQNK